MFTLSLRGNLILKILSCENPSNIWELKYRAQMWGANKPTGKMVLILQWERISSFDHGTFQRCVFIFYTRYVWTWRNCLSHKTWSHFLFAQHLEAYLMLGLWWKCLRYDNFFLILDIEESISKIDSHQSVWAVIVYLNGFLAIWAHKYVGKHMVSVNNSSLQFSNSRAVFEGPKWLWTINSYRHHNFGEFCRHIIREPFL